MRSHINYNTLAYTKKRQTDHVRRDGLLFLLLSHFDTYDDVVSAAPAVLLYIVCPVSHLSQAGLLARQYLPFVREEQQRGSQHGVIHLLRAHQAAIRLLQRLHVNRPEAAC
mmetsp:Transcript_89358/g.174887  ORF Transcript_89358/g.174887 Transcript_89358/m.174887 type:complete len:111 (-) Transcript_89358:279-611(-)